MSKLSELRDAQKAAPKKRTKSFLEDIRDGLGGYWTRQGKMAQGGLDWANKGFEKVRGGDPLGLLDEAGGALSYLASPVTALVPTRDEIAASQTPEWAKPIVSGAAQSALFALPGPDLGPAASTAGGALRGARDQAQMYMDDFAQKFGADVPAGVEVYGSGPVLRKPLGSNLGDLMAGGTEAERAALKARLDAEAVQAMQGGVPATATRDQALRNLTEAPTDPWLKPTPMDNYREAASLRMKIEPLETQLKAALQSKNATKAATLREKLKVIRDRVAQLSPGGPLLSADRVDEILRAHPNADLSAEDIAKMFPEGQ